MSMQPFGANQLIVNLGKLFSFLVTPRVSVRRSSTKTHTELCWRVPVGPPTFDYKGTKGSRSPRFLSRDPEPLRFLTRKASLRESYAAMMMTMIHSIVVFLVVICSFAQRALSPIKILFLNIKTLVLGRFPRSIATYTHCNDFK